MNTKQYGESNFEESLEQLGAFEQTALMREIAKKNERGNTYLNAGRGNPNWINTLARYAFARVQEFGIRESELTYCNDGIAGYTTLEGIAQRFLNFLDRDDKTDRFLQEAVSFCANRFDVPEDVFVKELADAIIGNNYPVPSRCLVNIEKILNLYLESTLYNGEKLANTTQIFPTEGGTAAICYIFESLRRNHIIQEGDKIAINIPIFTPYLQIPKLTMYEMVSMNLEASEENNWSTPLEEWDKLLDPEIKAFFLVNPSNPGSHALDTDAIQKIKEIAKKRKDLIIITDDVYGTFVNGFQSVYSVAPYNTILVYSFSKLYGATGWRIGMIAMNEHNIFDDLIAQLPEEIQREFDEDYGIVTTNPRKLPFIERLAADSRAIGLYHTSGLSTPQQGMMALFALTHLVYHKNDPYFQITQEIIDNRYHLLFDALGLEEDNDRTNSKYYSMINVYKLAEKRHGKAFSFYLKGKYQELDFLYRLSKEEGIVLMDGVGFASTVGTLRVSQANLLDRDYPRIARRILNVLDEYYIEFKKNRENL